MVVANRNEALAARRGSSWVSPAGCHPRGGAGSADRSCRQPTGAVNAL